MQSGMLVMGSFAAPHVIAIAVLCRTADTQGLHVGCTPDVPLCRRMRGGLPAGEAVS